MKQCSVLDKCGANPWAYAFGEPSKELSYKLPASHSIVYQLPDAFVKYSPSENDLFSDTELTHYNLSTYKDLQEAAVNEVENQIFNEHARYPYECLYDRKRVQMKDSDKIDPTIKETIKGFPMYLPKSSKDETLGFESRFESGNLGYAYKRADYEYDLYLSPDYGSNKQIGWFFFKVYNTRKDRAYKFNICNLLKSDTVFNQGSKILCYSERLGKFMYKGVNVMSYQNELKRPNYSNYCTLTFQINFPEDNDSFFLMNSVPYTYSRLMSFINHIESNDAFKAYVECKALTETPLGNKSPLIVVCDKSIQKPKKVLLIDGRQHPGEPLGSFVVEKLLEQALSSGSIGETLRENFVFYFCPMLNVDGVLLGNQRLNSQGLDLNRVWNEPSKEKSPTILAIKALAKNIKEEGKDIFAFLDIHAHSRKFNCFFYSNPLKDKKDHVIVHLMQKYCSLYSVNDTTYKITKEKENSARVIVWKEIGVKLCYTLEVGYGGVTMGTFRGNNHSLSTLSEVGVGLAKSLIDMTDIAKCKSLIFNEEGAYDVLVVDSDKLPKTNTQQSINSPHVN